MPRALAVPHLVQETGKRAQGGSTVTFPTRPGNEQRTFDLDEVALSEDIKAAFRYAIVNHPRAIAHHTQEQYWYSITTFARFAKEDGLHGATGLNTACIKRYREWLTRQANERTGERWSDIHQGKKLISLKELVHTVKTQRPQLLPSEIIFPTYFYAEGTPKETGPKRRLTQEQLKSLMWACQCEIRESKHRFDIAQRILAGQEKETLPGMRRTLLAAEKLRRTGQLTARALQQEGTSDRLVNDLGGMEGLRAHLGATSRTLIPFAISLLVQLAGNVDPIRKLKVNCERTDEIDERWSVIEWEKPRAGAGAGETQRRFVDRRQRYGAAALIAMVRTLTGPTRSLVNSDDADKLFIRYPYNKTNRGGLLSYDEMKTGAKRFLDDARQRIKVWNEAHPDRPKEQIPDFSLREIRSSVAVQEYIASGGDVGRVQRRLNHGHTKTTAGYLESEAARDKNAQIISAVQTSIVGLANRHTTEERRAGEAKPRAEEDEMTATPAFSHECRDPQGESKRLCIHFQKCLDCPGLIIPTTPENLAVLLQAEEKFRAAKQKLHPERWRRLYARSYATLTRRIIPEFPSEMFEEAHQLKNALPALPDLE